MMRSIPLFTSNNQDGRLRARGYGYFLLSAAILLLAVPDWAVASGGYRPGGGGGGGYGSPSPANSRLSDPLYDVGKSLYQGRNRRHRGLQICLLETPANERSTKKATDQVPLSRKHIRGHRNSTVLELTTQMVRCGEPETAITSVLSTSDLEALLHFLNKRYRLRLKAS